MPEVNLKIGAYIEQLKKRFGEAKTVVANFTNFVKTHEAKIRSIRMKAGIALGVQVLAVRSLVKAYEKQEQADAKLLQAMKNRGIYTAEAYEQTKEFANEMQRLTKTGNEVVEEIQSILISLGGLRGEGLERATLATLDLATGMKMDAVAAAALMAKSIGSTTNALVRYGITMKEGVSDPTERANELTKKIAEMFGGQAQAAAQTYTGQLTQLGNIIGDLKEDLGEAILPMIMKFARILRENLPAIRSWVQEHKKLIAVIIGGGIGGAGLLFALSSFALAFSNPVTGIIAVVALSVIAIAALVAWVDKLGRGVQEIPDSIEGMDKAIEKVGDEILRMQETIEALKLDSREWEAGGETIASYEKRIKSMVKTYETLLAARAKLAEQVKEAGGPGAEAGLPAEIEGPDISTLFPEIPGDELQGELLEGYQSFKDELSDIDAEYWRNRIENAETAQEAEHQIALAAAHGLVAIWDRAFSNIIKSEQGFMTNLGLAMLEGFMAMLQMAVDMAVQNVYLKFLEEKGKILLSSLWNPANLGKLVIAGAIMGGTRAALGSVLAGAREKAAGSVPRFQYGGVLPESGLYYGEKGEHFFNPDHPEESMRNMGGAMQFHWHQYAPVRSKSDVYEGINEWEDNLIARRLTRRST